VAAIITEWACHWMIGWTLDRPFS